MRGTRYGDFSRFTFDPAKGYRGVLIQQGRVQLDADLNEAGALLDHRLRTAVDDLLGGSCAPGQAPGFGLRPRVALHFDGSDRLTLADGPRLAASGGAGEHGARTFELWLRWEGGAGVIVDCSDGKGPAYTLWIDEDGFLHAHLTTALDVADVPLRASRAVEPERQTHVALLLDATFAALFVDGLQVARDDHDGLRALSAPTVVLGAPAPGGPRGDVPEGGFVGLMSEVQVWGRTRSPVELSDAAMAAAPPPPGATALEPRAASAQAAEVAPTGLLAAWRFDPRQGPLLADAVTQREAQPGSPPRWRLVDLEIGAGRFYVDGVLCEQRALVRYTRQPGGARRLPWAGRHLAYLEVWEETVTAVQDPDLADVALGGLDTAVRTRVVGQVRLTGADGVHGPRHADGLHAALRTPDVRPTGRLRAEHVGDVPPGNHLYRIEVHADGELVDEDGGDGAGGSAGAGAGGGAGEDPYSLEDEERTHRPRRRRPTFKWSRDNGTSLFAVAPVPHEATEADVVRAQSGVEPLGVGDVVEALGARAGGPDGVARPLLRVVDAAEPDGRVRLDGRVPEGTEYLRRWDHDGDPDALAAAGHRGGAELPVTGGWWELEDGIRVCFTPGTYRRGDYWWVVARMDTRTIAWPHEHGRPVALPPSGVERLVTPLAIIDLDDDKVRVQDVRRVVRAVVAGPGEEHHAAPPTATPAPPDDRPHDDPDSRDDHHTHDEPESRDGADAHDEPDSRDDDAAHDEPDSRDDDAAHDEPEPHDGDHAHDEPESRDDDHVHDAPEREPHDDAPEPEPEPHDDEPDLFPDPPPAPDAPEPDLFPDPPAPHDPPSPPAGPAVEPHPFDDVTEDVGDPGELPFDADPATATPPPPPSADDPSPFIGVEEVGDPGERAVPEPAPGAVRAPRREPEPAPPAAVSAPRREPEPAAPATPGTDTWHQRCTVALSGETLQGAASVRGLLLLTDGHRLHAVAPGTGELRPLKPLPAARRGIELTVAGDLVLVVGGGAQAEQPDGRLFALDLTTAQWRERAKQPKPATHPAVAVANGRVHVAGGQRHGLRGRTALDDHHVFDLAAGTWRDGPALKDRRSGAAAVAVGSTLHVLGGYGSGNHPGLSRVHEVLDLAGGTAFERAPEVPAALPVAGAAVHRGALTVLLGTSVWTFSGGAWQELAALPEPLARPLVTSHDDRLHIVGTTRAGTPEARLLVLALG